MELYEFNSRRIAGQGTSELSGHVGLSCARRTVEHDLAFGLKQSCDASQLRDVDLESVRQSDQHVLLFCGQLDDGRCHRFIVWFLVNDCTPGRLLEPLERG